MEKSSIRTESVWEDRFKHPITNGILIIIHEVNLTKKESKSMQNSKQNRKFVNEVNEQLAIMLQ